MKSFLIILFSIFCSYQLKAQNIYFTETGSVTFSSTTIFETFQARNEQVPSLLDINSGRITFSALLQTFDFKNRLMKKQFNEYIIDSEEFPRADFKGNIINLKEIDFRNQSPQRAEIEGKMYLNGEKMTIQIFGLITVQDNKIQASSTFSLNPSDFNIEIPQPLEHKIAKNIYVTVEVLYEPFID